MTKNVTCDRLEALASRLIIGMMRQLMVKLVVVVIWNFRTTHFSPDFLARFSPFLHQSMGNSSQIPLLLSKWTYSKFNYLKKLNMLSHF